MDFMKSIAIMAISLLWDDCLGLIKTAIGKR